MNAKLSHDLSETILINFSYYYQSVKNNIFVETVIHSFPEFLDKQNRIYCKLGLPPTKDFSSELVVIHLSHRSTNRMFI